MSGISDCWDPAKGQASPAPTDSSRKAMNMMQELRHKRDFLRREEEGQHVDQGHCVYCASPILSQPIEREYCNHACETGAALAQIGPALTMHT